MGLTLGGHRKPSPVAGARGVGKRRVHIEGLAPPFPNLLFIIHFFTAIVLTCVEVQLLAGHFGEAEIFFHT